MSEIDFTIDELEEIIRDQGNIRDNNDLDEDEIKFTAQIEWKCKRQIMRILCLNHG